MICLLTLLTLTSVTSAPGSTACDAACRAVLDVAFEWVLERIPAENRERAFLNVGVARTGWEEESSESRAQTQVLRELAVAKAMPVLRREEAPRFIRCGAEPDSSACRVFAGTTAFTFRNLEFLSAEEAIISAHISVINEEGASSPEHLAVWQLRLLRNGEVWQVREATILLQS